MNEHTFRLLRGHVDKVENLISDSVLGIEEDLVFVVLPVER
jgi:hypothetical protein